MRENYIKGILGALIGGILFSLPWVLVYVYLNYILSLLAAVIALGAFTFYKLFGGMVDKKTPLIIGISSVLSVTLAMFVIIPMFLLFKEGYGFDINKFKLLYMNDTFVSAVLKDYITSLLFTILGISGVISNIRHSVYSKDENNAESTNYIENYSDEEQINIFREVFASYKAFDKKSTVPSSIILSKINSKNKNAIFTKLQKRGIIVTTLTGKCYFNEEAINNPAVGKKAYTNFVLKIVFIALAICAVFTTFALISDSSYDESHTTKDIKEKPFTFNNISISLPETYKLGESTESYEVLSNYGKTGPTQIMLQQVGIAVKDDEKVSYKDNYVKYIGESEDIKDTKEVKVDGLEAYRIFSIHKKYTDEYYYTYLIFGSSNTYIITFYDNITDPSNSKYLENFEREANIFSNKIVINEGQL